MRHELPLWIEPAKEAFSRYVMTENPDVVSMDRRCIDQGYDFPTVRRNLGGSR